MVVALRSQPAPTAKQSYYVTPSPLQFNNLGLHYPSASDGPQHYDSSHPNDIGNFECVAYVRQLLNLPPSGYWRPGQLVKGNTSIPYGAAIATFTGDVYQGHAAIYLGQNGAGIQVADQWNSAHHAGRRTIKFPKPGVNVSTSNNGNLFRVVDPILTRGAATDWPETGRVVSD